MHGTTSLAVFVWWQSYNNAKKWVVPLFFSCSIYLFADLFLAAHFVVQLSLSAIAFLSHYRGSVCAERTEPLWLTYLRACPAKA
jgi:hypothetical protein